MRFRSYRLTDSAVAEKVREPKGDIYRSFAEVPGLDEACLVTVGDFVSSLAIKSGVYPHIMIIDGKVERRKFEFLTPPEYLVLRVRNPAGYITADAWCAVKKAFEIVKEGKRVCLIVDGEEDLLGFPVAILSDEGVIMIYGQPREGMVAFRVTKEVKKRAKMLLAKFEEVENYSNQSSSSSFLGTYVSER